MFDKFKPLADRVLVKRLDGQEKTEGGLYIPETAKEKAQTGAVVAVGTGRRDGQGKVIPMAVKAGDIVFFGKYTGTETDDQHIILREDDILGIVEK